MADYIHVNCPKCSMALVIPEAMAGDKLTCERCGQVFQTLVPVGPAPPPELPKEDEPKRVHCYHCHRDVVPASVEEVPQEAKALSWGMLFSGALKGAWWAPLLVKRRVLVCPSCGATL